MTASSRGSGAAQLAAQSQLYGDCSTGIGLVSVNPLAETCDAG
jgi:hypothetical protein